MLKRNPVCKEETLSYLGAVRSKKDRDLRLFVGADVSRNVNAPFFLRNDAPV
jgi:hypothetical protein